MLSVNLTSPIKKIFTSKLFILILIAKIIFSFKFASYYLTDLFIPFTNWFTLSGFENPWEYFYSINKLKMFPYPTVMLWIMTVPRVLFSFFLSNDWQTVSFLHLFVARIPLLTFDLLLFYLFLKMFPTKKELVLYVYWCSPIIFFINYIHGQLDIIPTTIFFYAIYLLVNKRYFLSALLTAIAAATKSHVLIFLPFILLFMYKQRIKATRLIAFLFILALLYFMLIFPYVFSDAFIEMVFKAAEQKRIYEFAIPVSKTLNIVVCPVVIFILFMKFASYKKLNKEILFMFAGIVFACFVVFVTPMPGWFLWSLPFLVYFYINNVEYSRAPFILYNFIYIVYFLFFFEKQPQFLNSFIEPSLSNNLALSLMISSVAFITIWMYQNGIRRNEELRIKEKPFLIGIAGDSATGKHTTFKELRKLLGENQCVPVFGDNFHKWERGNENWQVYTHLNPSANYLYESVNKAVALKEGNEIDLVEYDHNTGKFTNPKTIEPNKFIFFVGLHPFYLKNMRELIDIKLYMDADENLRKHWKVARDVEARGYDKEKVVEQINSRMQDSVKFIHPQKAFADLIITSLPVDEKDLNAENKQNVKIKRKFVVDNSINLEGLLIKLQEIQSLKVEHSHLSDLMHQELVVEGTIPKNDVKAIAYSLGFNFDELLIMDPDWMDDLSGITQLLFMVVYNNKMKAKA